MFVISENTRALSGVVCVSMKTQISLEVQVKPASMDVFVSAIDNFF